MTTGENIRKARKLKGLTQIQLGELTGIHEVLIRRYEYGDRNPKTPQLQKISYALDVHINALKELQIISYEDLMFSLFEIEDSFGDIEFHVHGGNVFIGIDNLEIERTLIKLMNKKEELHNGLITEDEYITWRYNYNPKER